MPLALAVAAIVLIVAIWRGDSRTAASSADPLVSPFQVLGEPEDGGFGRVPLQWTFRFPDDHGRHGEYRTEWWYLAGTISDHNDRQLGLQFILMRVGLTAQPQERASRWAASEIYAGLLSVSDPATDSLRTYRRVARAAVGLAGADSKPTRIWVENWWLERIESDSRPEWRLHIAADDLDLELELHDTQPLIDTNDIRTQDSIRSAPFHFYVQPRLGAEGLLRMAERRASVRGNLSMEHAWGELPLPGGPVARDRFTLHLDDDRTLFCVRTHRVDGSGPSATTGLLIDRNGDALVLTRSEIELEPTDHWASNRTGASYPIRWMLRIPDHGIELQLLPYWQDQEGSLWAPFWAGSVRLQTTSGSRSAGHGLVVLNGYERS